MSTLTRSVPSSSNTDANLRLWGKFISDTFALSFLQFYSNINFATLVTSASTGVILGKEIWSSNDATGSLNNFFVLIEYSTGTVSAVNATIYITIGWAHDGSGNLTGVTTTRTVINASSGVATLAAAYGSADAGRVRFSTGAVNGQSFIVGIERLRENGSYINKVNVSASHGSSVMYSQTSKNG
jgi:hypothetical protein